jgi:hypothetical protein
VQHIRIIVGASLWLLGCGDAPPIDELEPLPPIVGEGERVRIATDAASVVCAGTLAWVDAELDRVEQELQLDGVDSTVDVYLLDATALAERCGPGLYSCSVAGDPAEIYVRAELYEMRVVHELVHDRIAYTPAAGSAPLFDEGLAAAHARPWCPPLSSWTPPSADALLDADHAAELPQHGEYLGGELVRWLLDAHGPTAVLDFMAALGETHDAAEIRAAYLDHFGAELDTDLFAHLRALDKPLPPSQSGCLAPDAPVSSRFVGYELEAQLDCSSPLVHNDFAHPGNLYVEWTLEVDAIDGAVFGALGYLPPNSELRIEPCGCQQGEGTTWSSATEFVLSDWTHYFEVELAPGRYRVRWSAPSGTTLDLDLVEPCDLVAQDCPDGFVCNISNVCIPPPVNPKMEGEPCNLDSGYFSGNCDFDLACAADWPDDGIDGGVCMTYCGDGDLGVECPDGLGCDVVTVCAEVCDPLLQDCEVGWTCYPDFTTGAGACVPSGESGLLESCNILYPYCETGLFCTIYGAIEGCQGEGWFSFDGCCMPVCDPTALDPGCPPELPNCLADEGLTIGWCTL